MSAAIREALELALDRRDVPADVMEQAVGALMDGKCEPVEIAALLTALRTKGESINEIVGAARAMRRRVTRIPTTRHGLLDTCGTGGDRTHTFNISTATALVVAAAGVPVAKHGNRSVSSASGSADVLEALGVNVQLSPQQVAQCLDNVGIGFCYAPLLHSAMEHAAPVRRQLGFRTIFNLLGPLTNPAGAEFQLLGANRYETAGKIARALSQLGCRHALVVCCDDGLDEVGLWGRTAVFAVADGRVTEIVWTADSFGLPECRLEDLQVRTANESAEVIRRVLAGQSGPERNIILANAAAALIAAHREKEPTRAVRIAAEAIDSGRARELLRRLADFTKQD